MYWVKFAAFAATITAAFVVTALVTTIAFAIIGVPAGLATFVGAILSVIAGIGLSLRLFTVPKVAIVWTAPVAAIREMAAHDVMARLDRAA